MHFTYAEKFLQHTEVTKNMPNTDISLCGRGTPLYTVFSMRGKSGTSATCTSNKHTLAIVILSEYKQAVKNKLLKITYCVPYAFFRSVTYLRNVTFSDFQNTFFAFKIAMEFKLSWYCKQLQSLKSTGSLFSFQF